MKSLKILYLALQYDYGDPARGLSFEHENFYDALVQQGHQVLHFDFFEWQQKLGRQAMNRRLWETVQAERPDVMFSLLFQDELDPAVVRRISAESGTTTINWFADDHWRFESFTRRWAPCFHWSVTTNSAAPARYRAIGYQNVIHSQWACNPHRYQRLDLPPAYDVTFVGQPHGVRRQMLRLLRDRGINVQVWGNGWEGGRLSQAEMIRVFNQSRINLNFSSASQDILPLKLIRIIEKRLPALGLGLRRAFNRLPGHERLYAVPAERKQIKGRHFEVPACGGFLLTDPADNLADYYRPGQEIACFESERELMDQIRYYLSHEDERQALAEAGYRRTLAEHTYDHRFEQIFRAAGLLEPTP